MRLRFCVLIVALTFLLPGCFRYRKTNSLSTKPTSSSPGRVALNAKSATTTKGKMTLNVEGTNLDFPLDVLKIREGSFQLTGQGTKLVGSVPNSLPGQWAGQTLRITPQENTFGNSELDLPGTGIAPVAGGQIEVESATGQRLKGRISFRVQGPFGERTFAGTFEVGAIQEQ
jgi:hypothetical protein